MRDGSNVLVITPRGYPRDKGVLKKTFSELVNEFNYDQLTTALQHNFVGYCIIFLRKKERPSVPLIRII